MLFECSCEATQKIINDAIAQDVYLYPRENTPLKELVKCTTVVPIVDLTAKLGEELKVIDPKVLEEQSNNNSHNGWIDEVSARCAEIINRRVDVIKTTVLPVVRSITDNVLKDVDEAQINDDLSNIVKYVACDMINIPSFMEEVRRNKRDTYLEPDTYFTQEPTSVEKVVEMLKTGSNAADVALGVSLNKIGVDNLYDLYNSIFVDRAKSDGPFRTISQFFNDPTFGLDYSVIIFQLASVLSNERQASREHKEAAAFRIEQYARQYKADIDGGKLIKVRANKQGDIEVYAINYTAFLQRGGTAEMVIGAAANSNYYFTIDAILDHSKEVLNDYQILKSATSLESRKKIREVVQKSLYQNFMRSFKHEKSDYEKAYFEKNQGDESACIRNFETALVSFGAESVKDIHRRVAEVLCLSRFFYVDCYPFLKLIDELCESGVDAESALTQVTLQEICMFTVNQITTSKLRIAV